MTTDNTICRLSQYAHEMIPRVPVHKCVNHKLKTYDYGLCIGFMVCADCMEFEQSYYKVKDTHISNMVLTYEDWLNKGRHNIIKYWMLTYDRDKLHAINEYEKATNEYNIKVKKLLDIMGGG
jgi:hypothetical protein